MKKRYIFLVIFTLFFIWIMIPHKYVTKLEWDSPINADKLMKTGDYYFMCKENFGYLIKKDKPTISIKGKDVEIYSSVDNGRKKIISDYISDGNWLDGFEYKGTELKDTGRLSYDLYTKKLDKEYSLLILDRIYNGKNNVTVILAESNIHEEYEKTYSELISLAKERCKKIGIDE
ncbi:hypothetical protein UA38_21215 [Photobacterium kishitanii]|uniref:Uncharacterized protein n=1 Tax=Photobacterium kishitanii TaxID=318456 RepID=A0AAX0YPP1_9GAMM|nr:hypothetical protein [Photobacterium kishitanii]KJG55133.1 hypothetical protein UA38_21215 [Photobacterium kishitanii]KJG57303.1 hypothetical protein UA42_21540 [Photobacterium kishitanii]KJG63488.1 hypothetical protein UA40_21605 [Photobacterium kishitanii]KJG69356.1 hypothetical protein UA41_11445 [Photobacterium kishitanii]PSX17613.1 hypothetical protein C0W70_19055 [Photobacterium kishitanii]